MSDSEELDRERLVLALKDREGSECIYKEGIALCRARLTAVRFDDEMLRFTLDELPTWGESDRTDGPFEAGGAWFDLDCPDPPVYIMGINGGWTLFFDGQTVREAAKLAASGAEFEEVVSRLNRLLKENRSEFRVGGWTGPGESV